MGLFGFGKNRDVLDLSERLRGQQESRARAQEAQGSAASTEESSQAVSPFTFFDNPASSTSADTQRSGPEIIDLGNQGAFSPTEDKKKKLIKRIMDMTTKLEDLSNQIYHLQQRVEVLERRSN
ncbi:MAG: hypothetical protein KJ879_00480 [Nanoarchaeota archaeon]|nr:hypothetical protein [Nanoarchaeota archaeon]